MRVGVDSHSLLQGQPLDHLLVIDVNLPQEQRQSGGQHGGVGSGLGGVNLQGNAVRGCHERGVRGDLMAVNHRLDFLVNSAERLRRPLFDGLRLRLASDPRD